MLNEDDDWCPHCVMYYNQGYDICEACGKDHSEKGKVYTSYVKLVDSMRDNRRRGRMVF